jgi:hypothetical protein
VNPPPVMHQAVLDALRDPRNGPRVALEELATLITHAAWDALSGVGTLEWRAASTEQGLWIPLGAAEPPEARDG